MLLAESNASTVLTWVRPDLDKHLDQIRLQFEHIADSKYSGGEVANAASNLTQLKYTFEALVLRGATLVAEEMITLCDALERDNVRDPEKAIGALMDAIVVVPSYLDRLQAGHHDLPILLLPVINELRAAYNANIVSEATLFAPDLDVPLPELEAELDGASTTSDEPLPALLRRTRRQYENALLAWLQDQDNIELLSPIHSVCETLHRRLQGIELRRLWWIAAEVIGGILDGVAENDIHLRRLFARLHLILKTLANGGEAAVSIDSVNSVSQALLFHVAQAKSGCAGVDMLRERFSLNELIPDRDVLIRARGAVSGRNRELYISLGAAVRDELSMVKDALDLELRTGEVEPERRENSHEALLRLKDTLKMMGLSDSAQSIEDLMPVFEASGTADLETGSSDATRESLLMGLAGKLIQVESVLEEQIATLGEPLINENVDSHIDLPLHEQQRIRAHLLAEMVNSLHQTQEGVRQYFAGNQDADYSTALEHVAGALELIDETETAQLALKLRNALNNLLRVAKIEAGVDPQKLEFVTDAVAAFELYLAACRDQQSNRERFLDIIKQRLEQLPTGKMEVVEPIEQQTTTVATDTPSTQAEELSEDSAVQSTLNAELLEVFLEEYESVAAMLSATIPLWMQQQDNSSLTSDIRRGFHTLKGSGRMVGADEMGDFSWHIEEMLNNLLDNDIDAFADVGVIVNLAHAALPAMKKRLLQQPTELSTEGIAVISQLADEIAFGKTADWTQISGLLPASMLTLVPADIAPAAATQKQVETSDPTLKTLICKELSDKLITLKGLMDDVLKDHDSVVNDEHIIAAHTIAGTTALEPLGREPEIAKALEGFLEAQKQSRKSFNDTAVWAIATSLAHLETCLAIHEGDADASLTEDEQSQIDQLLALTLEFEPSADDLAKATETRSKLEQIASEEAPEPDAEAEPDADEDESVDTEILSIFLEEAADIMASCDSLLDTWRDNLSDLEIVKNLQREIHTFKGGARMSGVNSMSGLSHAMENLMEQIAGRLLPPSVAAIEAFEQGCDHLTAWVEQASEGTIPRIGEALKQFEQQAQALTDSSVQPVATADEPVSIESLTEAPEVVTDDEVPAAEARPDTAIEDKAAVKAADQKEEDQEVVEQGTKEPEVEPEPEAVEVPETAVSRPEPAAQEKTASIPTPEPAKSAAPETPGAKHIRVDADLLDSLVNSAGEISIFRSRLEQQVSQQRETLKEFDETVSRLREQFRKLELETETQIRSRYQQETSNNSEEFDPLELDRFSAMQQLSRGLSESVSDLLNLQELLDDTARKSEALLVQQSRVSVELQEGLMQTRMVHFGTIAPRLRRIVRTAANETKKKARLQLRMTGGGDQLDRNVLERITAPLEHLLRNAIAHGIESPKLRQKLNKRKEGEISITVAAEATEFVIRVEDDGAGLNLKAIHKRAIESGLIDKDANPPPQQLLQFILHSGFSTSKTVTGLAGRGVGMDVVNSEIKQIGGSLEIDSETGKGSCFTIRIPFTLAVMQAIGVMAGEHRYMVPLASVAGVARILPADYQKLLKTKTPSYEFAGEKFTVLELEPLLGEPSTPVGEETVSILLVKSGEHRAAFRVPELLGHSEIIIKPVGPQISSVAGILGGTITANGQVIIIIDTGPLIRQALLTGARPAPPLEITDMRPDLPLAMVVDDSITMRKVTSRVLEGYDFEVITARDGVDATEQMQERIPDLLLLDVEMPRMDGYQVAEYVRADPRLRHIPIIMITSRAGDKHRERGMQAGANAYLSKPYKESDLINEVKKLLGNEAH